MNVGFWYDFADSATCKWILLQDASTCWFNIWYIHLIFIIFNWIFLLLAMTHSLTFWASRTTCIICGRRFKETIITTADATCNIRFFRRKYFNGWRHAVMYFECAKISCTRMFIDILLSQCMQRFRWCRYYWLVIVMLWCNTMDSRLNVYWFWTAQINRKQKQNTYRIMSPLLMIPMCSFAKIKWTNS